MQPAPHDSHGRPLGVLRLSLTARCNLACPYCLPDGTEPPGLLSQSQRLAVVEAAVALGARRLRLTGGEPLLHPGLEALIAAAAPLRLSRSSAAAAPDPGWRSSKTRASAQRPAQGSGPTKRRPFTRHMSGAKRAPFGPSASGRADRDLFHAEELHGLPVEGDLAARRAVERDRVAGDGIGGAAIHAQAADHVGKRHPFDDD